MRKEILYAMLSLILLTTVTLAKTLTYNQLDIVNLCDQGIPADQRSTHVLVASGNIIYGATSGHTCHVFRFDPKTKKLTVLASIEGPNTILKGMVLDEDTIYVGTMLSKRQLWWTGQKRGGSYELVDANLYTIDDLLNTGHLYKIAGINSANPKISDLGIPVSGQGIHTMAIDSKKGLIYGLTYPTGRFFIFDTKSGKTETITFGTSAKKVSNHMVSSVAVIKDLTSFLPGEVEFNNKLVAKAMYVTKDGTLYTSGWRGQIVKYDPDIKNPEDRFAPIAYIPSVPGRQHWNRIDEIIEYNGMLYMGTSDGYIISLNPSTNTITNYGKPIRAIEVMGLAFSTIDGKLYGVNGGDEDGISRFWCYDLDTGNYEVDYPAIQIFNNRRAIGDVVCTGDGTLVIGETMRVANLWMLTPGEKKEWQKSGVMKEGNPKAAKTKQEPKRPFIGDKKLEVDVYPIPSAMHGGSGYTAIQADNDGKIYIGGAYYGKFGSFLQLDPETAKWRMIFRSDELLHRYARGQGTPGKLHTKFRLGSDGKIYGAMKQGYEFHYTIRSDVGEAPEGVRGSQMTCNAFSYDPKTDTVEDMGPGWPQEGITSFQVDVDRGYVYGVTVPGVYFIVYNLKTGRVWNAGPIAGPSPSRYMDIDYVTGKVYHRGEATPDGRYFMTVWDPEEFRLRDIEISPEEGLSYSHSYAICSGPVGSHKLYGQADGKLCEMDLIPGNDGRLHVRPLCTIFHDQAPSLQNMYAIATGPDDRIYWCSTGAEDKPMFIFSWNPETETKTYLGTCSLHGTPITGHTQGICFDKKGNMAVHVLYAGISPGLKKYWKVSDDFFYQDIIEQPYYLGYPSLRENTYYSVFYVKDAISLK